MAYHRVASIVDQHLTQDMANYQLSRSLVSVGYYVNVETRSSITHYHPYYEFILVRRGICASPATGTRSFLPPDEMLIIAPGTAHAMHCPEDSSRYERLILQVDAGFMAQVTVLCQFGEASQPIPPLFILTADAVCRWGFRELIERINASAAVTETALRERLFLFQIAELMLTVTHVSRSAEALTVSASSALISDVTAYIQDHFREQDLNVAGLAQMFYVSREHLSRSFRTATDESISHFLTDLRMQEFRYGLLKGKSVLDACLESGFSDYSSFIKSFRKLYGITPVEYREQLRSAMSHVPKGEVPVR